MNGLINSLLCLWPLCKCLNQDNHPPSSNNFSRKVALHGKKYTQWGITLVIVSVNLTHLNNKSLLLTNNLAWKGTTVASSWAIILSIWAWIKWLPSISYSYFSFQTHLYRTGCPTNMTFTQQNKLINDIFWNCSSSIEYILYGRKMSQISCHTQ